MPNTVLSPVMNMPVPVPGTDPGPQYAFDLNSCLSILDQHDHTPGLGNPITPSAMDINTDLTFAENNAVNLRTVRFRPQLSPLTLGADVGCAYVAGVDLWYNDVNGNQIQMTSNGGVAGTPGSIANLVAPASASYVGGSSTFVFQSDVNQAANIDGASYILRNIPGTFGLTLSPPALGSNFTITLPTLPSVPSFVSIDASGGMGDAIPLSQGIDTANIADNAITTPLIADASVTAAKLASNIIDTANIVDGAVTPPKLSAFNSQISASSNSFTTTSGSQTLVVSANPITTSGRPVMIMLESASPTSDGSITIIDGTNPPVGVMYYTRDTTDVAKERFPSSIIGASYPIPGMHQFVDTPAAGTYTYKLQANVISSPTTVLSITNMRLRVYEL